MNKAMFTAYSLSTDYAGVSGPTEHVFVVSSENNYWNCFGRGGPDWVPQAHQIAQGPGYAKWADLINGTDPVHPTGLSNYFDGVCHNVANRLLILAGTNVSKAAGDPLAILMYGKFGFGIDQLVARIKAAAEEINKNQPGTLLQADVDDVLNQVTRGGSDELEILEQDFQDLLQANNENLNGDQADRLLVVYKDFHDQRQNVWAAQQPPSDLNSEDADKAFQYALRQSMKPILIQSLTKISQILSADQFTTIFKNSPEQAVAHLLNV